MTIKKLFKKAIGAIVAGAMAVAMAVPAMAGTDDAAAKSTVLYESETGNSYDGWSLADGSVDLKVFKDTLDPEELNAGDTLTITAKPYKEGEMKVGFQHGGWLDIAGLDFQVVSSDKGSYSFELTDAVISILKENATEKNYNMVLVAKGENVTITKVTYTKAASKTTYPLAKVTVDKSGKPYDGDVYKLSVDAKAAVGEANLDKVTSVVADITGEEYFDGTLGAKNSSDEWISADKIMGNSGKNEFKLDIEGISAANTGVEAQIWWMNAKGSEKDGFTPATLTIEDVRFLDKDGNVLGTVTAKSAADTVVIEPKKEEPSKEEPSKEEPTKEEPTKEEPSNGGKTEENIWTGSLVMGAKWSQEDKGIPGKLLKNVKAGSEFILTVKPAADSDIQLKVCSNVPDKWETIYENYEITADTTEVEIKIPDEMLNNLANIEDSYIAVQGKNITVTALKAIVPVSDSKPSIKGADGKEGWEAITSEVTAAKDGATITVEMNGATKVPGNVVAGIKGKDVTVVIDLGNGISWSINGKTVTSDKVADIDFSLKKDTNAVPADTVKKVADGKTAVQFSLAHDGNFGFDAVLSIDLDKKNAGLYANLFYYNPTSKALEFVEAAKIAEDGTAALAFKHASDYVIVLDKTAYSTEATTTTQATASNATGDSANIGLIIALAAAVAVLGVTVAVKKRATEE